MTQTNLIDQLEKHTERSVYVAGAFADPAWMREARATVEILCRQGEDFTGDDVWELLEGTKVTTPEPRALGAVIRQFSKDGKIFATGAYRKSLRKESHRRPLTVWRPVHYKRMSRGG